MDLSAFVCVSEEPHILRWLGFCWVLLFPSWWLMAPPYSVSRFKSSHMIPGRFKISFTWLPQTSMESDLEDEIWFLTASGPLGAHKHSSFSLYPSPFLSPSQNGSDWMQAQVNVAYSARQILALALSPQPEFRLI